MFQKVALLEISRSSLSTRVAGLQYTFCNATKCELQTKFFEGAFKFTENFQEVNSNRVPYQKFTDLQTAAFKPCIFLKFLK